MAEDMIWAAYILFAGLSGVLVLDVCAYMVSANGRYDLRKRASGRAAGAL